MTQMTLGQERGDTLLQQTQLEKDMLTKDKHTLIKDLFRQGVSKRGISRFLGVDIKTVRRHLQKAGWTPYSRPEEKRSVLAPYMPWLFKRLKEVDYNARVLYRELCHQGYTGSYETVKKCVSEYRVRPLEKACVRFETSPGQQSQVDWGNAWTWFGEQRVKVHIFSMVLGFSRRLFGRAYENEKLGCLIQGHERAFEWFGGMTREILYDNPKTMVTLHDPLTGQLIMNKKFEDFVHYYGFQGRFCWPYRPETKGKIESGVKYIKRNFLKGRRFKDLDHLNQELERWCLETADERIHGTTHERPRDRFQAERLIPVGRTKPYVFYPAISRKVSRDARVRLNSNDYSVPWVYAGQCVDLKVCGRDLHIVQNGETVAIHSLLEGRHQSSFHPAHYEGLLSYQRSLKALKEALPENDPSWVPEEEVEVRDLSFYERVSQAPLKGEDAHAL